MAVAARARTARRSTKGTRIPPPIPTVLQTSQEMRDTGDILTVNFGPNHPSTHGVLRLVVDLYGEDVVGLAGGDRLPAHRLREEHGAEDVVEGDHVSGAHRLRLVPEQRARLRARDREAARARDAAEGDLDAHAALRAEPHPLAPRLARHVAPSSSARSRCSGTRSASASRSSTCSSWSPARACTRGTSRPAASPRTSRAASTPSAASSSSGCRTRSTSTSRSLDRNQIWLERTEGLGLLSRRRRDRARAVRPGAARVGRRLGHAPQRAVPRVRRGRLRRPGATRTATSTRATACTWTRCASR